MLPQPISDPRCSPKLLLILPRLLELPRTFPTPALGSFVFLPPLDSGVNTEQVLGEGGVKIPLAFPSSTCFPKQTVSRQPAVKLCFLGSDPFRSCTKDILQDPDLSAMALPDLAREGCGCLLQLVFGHLSRSSPRVLSQRSHHEC